MSTDPDIWHICSPWSSPGRVHRWRS